MFVSLQTKRCNFIILQDLKQWPVCLNYKIFEWYVSLFSLLFVRVIFWFKILKLQLPLVMTKNITTMFHYIEEFLLHKYMVIITINKACLSGNSWGSIAKTMNAYRQPTSTPDCYPLCLPGTASEGIANLQGCTRRSEVARKYSSLTPGHRVSSICHKYTLVPLTAPLAEGGA